MIFKALAYIFSLLASLANLSMPYTYSSFSTELSGYPVTGYQLKVDMNNEAIWLKHGLSFDQFYGFEKTSDISIRHDAIAAVNGMFYTEFGMPLGIMIEDGQVLGIRSTRGPLFYVDDSGLMHMDDIEVKAYAVVGDDTYELYGVNDSAPNDSMVLYDSIYGRTDRIYRWHISYLIDDGIITDFIRSDSAVSLNDSDYVLSHVTDDAIYPFEIGDEIRIKYDYFNMETGDLLDVSINQSFQTAGWLVKDGINIARDYEPYIGYTTPLHPRTLIGITEDNQLVLMVIDGRQDHSTGVSGYQAAELMIEAGCVYAGHLDGGASSTMVINQEVVNQPSGGQERDVAHCILIQYDQEADLLED